MSSDVSPAGKQQPAIPEEWMTLRENHQYDYSLAVLAAQERDREAEREHNRRSQKTALLFFVGLAIFLLILTVAAFFLNKETFLLECVKYLAIGGGGGGIGYVFGFKKGVKKN